MHAFILSLVKQRTNPAVIAFHPAQCTQMLQRTAHHAGHGGNRFRHNGTMTIPMREKVSAKKRMNFTRANAIRSRMPLGL